MADISRRDSGAKLEPRQPPIKVPWIKRQSQGTLIALALVSSNLFGLFLAGTYEFLSLRGIVNVAASRFVLFGVWLIGCILSGVVVWSFGIAAKKRTIGGSIIILAVLLVALDWWAPKSAPTPPATAFMQLGYVQFVTTRIIAGDPITVNISIANKGQVPAENVYPFWELKLVPIPAGKSSKTDRDTHAQFLSDALQRHAEDLERDFHGVSVGVGHGVWNTLRLPEEPTRGLTQPQVSAIMHGNFRLYVYAWSRWRGSTNDLDFCEWLQPPKTQDVNDRGPIWHLCEQ